jgi:hypothetical protein
MTEEEKSVNRITAFIEAGGRYAPASYCASIDCNVCPLSKNINECHKEEAYSNEEVAELLKKYNKLEYLI